MALKFFVVLLVFYTCVRSGIGPNAEPLDEGSECTSGFITQDRLTALVQAINGTIVTRHNQQRIIPDINFTCNGVITKWIVGARWDGNDWYPDLQLWQETGNRTYTKVGNTTLRVGTESASGVYEYPVDPPLEFQAGDILGIFQPHRDDSRIRVDYERDNGPLNYFMFTGRQVEPPLEEFAIEGSQIQTQDATPLVAVEISTPGDVLQCTCGFMSVERLVILQTTITNNRQQRIFPQINFTCDGNITKWIMGALQNNDDDRDYFPELQIWRDSGNNIYTKVGNTPPGNATPFLQDMTTNAYEYTPEHPLEFQAGDILGVFQPRGALSRLRVYYEENDGPTSFDVRVGVEDTEPLLDTFNLTQPDVRTSSDLPLITVEISVSTSQESPLPTISTTTLQSPTITRLSTTTIVLPSFPPQDTASSQSSITRLSTSSHSIVPRSMPVSDTQSQSAEVEQTVSPSTSVPSVLNTGSPLPTTSAIEVEQTVSPSTSVPSAQNTASPFPTTPAIEVEQTVSPSTSVTSAQNTASPLPTTPAIEVEQSVSPSTSVPSAQNTASPLPSPQEKTTIVLPSFPPQDTASSQSPVAVIAGVSFGALVGIVLGIGVVVLVAVGFLKKQRKYTLPRDQQQGFNNPIYGGLTEDDTAATRYTRPTNLTTDNEYVYASVAEEYKFHTVSPDIDLTATRHVFDNPLYGDTEPMVMHSTGLYETVTDSKSSAHQEWGVYVPTEEQRKTLSNTSLQEASNGSIYSSLKHETSQLGSGQPFFEESEIYWVPSSNSAELYAQMAKFRYREIFRHQISTIERLGSGMFGTVDKGVWTSPRGSIEVAVKMLKREASEKDRVKFLQEAAIMGQFLHPNVVKLHGVVTIGEPMMIVLEFIAKGDLRSFLNQQKPSPGEMVPGDMPKLCLQFCHQVASGMAHLSGKSFVHRDLAARNVLVSEDNVCKIADFGMARDLEDEDYYVSHGGQVPVKWTAPEALNFKKYSTASDVWSYGAVMYEIWSLGHKPFEGYTNQQAMRLIDESYRLPPPPGCPKAMYSLMIQCWHPEKSSRPTFTDILRSLSQSDLLRWSEEDTRVHLQAAVLGAPLEAGKNLYPDLQGTYMA